LTIVVVVVVFIVSSIPLFTLQRVLVRRKSVIVSTFTTGRVSSGIAHNWSFVVHGGHFRVALIVTDVPVDSISVFRSPLSTAIMSFFSFGVPGIHSPVA
jgi:hypothetical protein